MWHNARTLFARRAAIAVFVLTFVASGLLAAAGGPQKEAGFLWIAQTNGLLNVATDDGVIRFELRHAAGVTGIGVNDISGELWAYGSKQLQKYSRLGQPLLSASTEPNTHGEAPVDIAVDGVIGNLWMAIKRDLYRFDLQGRLQQTIVLPQEAVGLSLDRDRSRLWVAMTRELQSYDLEGKREVRVEVVPLTGAVAPGGPAVQPVKIQDIVWDANRGELWLTLPNKLLRYDGAGAAKFEAAGDFAGAIASDGARGLWLAKDRVLAHISETGQKDLALEPFAGHPDKTIVDLVADPGDASVWVASTGRVRHYAVDGELLHELTPDLGDGAIRRLSRTALFADLEPPEVRIDGPSAGQLLNTNRPVVSLSYFDLGVGVDPDSVALRLNGAPAPAACTTAASSATCTIAQALPEGTVELSATVTDTVGNPSLPALVSFVVDTVPPAITIASPTPDSYTNQTELTVVGTLDEPATLLINGSSATVGSTGRFAFSLALVEGANGIELVAIDLAGNRSEARRTVVLDTVVPAAPDASLITLGESSGGQVTIRGAAGAVEAGSSVRVTNLRTGASVIVTAGADGSFVAAIGAEPDDSIEVSSADRAGNVSASHGARVPASLSVAIAEPLDGAVIQAETVLVAGTVKGTLNSGVSVNGSPATTLAAGDTLQFYRSVLLQPGANAIAVSATLQNGPAISRTITVTRSDPPIRVKMAPLTGMSPMGSSFILTGSTGGARWRVEYDFDGNGTVDLTKTTFSAANYTYPAPGLYRPRVNLYKQNATTRVYELNQQHVFAAAVFSAAQLQQSQDAVLRSIWSTMNTALAAGDVPAALTSISSSSRDLYAQVFRALGPVMDDVLDDMTHIEPIAIQDGYADYMVLNVRNGDAQVHVINFIQGPDGLWRIDSM